MHDVENGLLTHKDLMIYFKQGRNMIKPAFQKITMPAVRTGDLAELTVKCEQFNSEVELASYVINRHGED